MDPAYRAAGDIYLLATSLPIRAPELSSSTPISFCPTDQSSWIPVWRWMLRSSSSRFPPASHSSRRARKSSTQSSPALAPQHDPR